MPPGDESIVPISVADLMVDNDPDADQEHQTLLDSGKATRARTLVDEQLASERSNTDVEMLEDRTEPVPAVSGQSKEPNNSDSKLRPEDLRYKLDQIPGANTELLVDKHSEAKTGAVSIDTQAEVEAKESAGAATPVISSPAITEDPAMDALALYSVPPMNSTAPESTHREMEIKNALKSRELTLDNSKQTPILSDSDSVESIEEISIDDFDHDDYGQILELTSGAYSALNFEPQSEFGKYQLLGRIAQGGMAEIYLALRTEHEESHPCVIKRIQSERLEDEDRLRLFQEEGRLCMSLDHPNIVRHHEFGEIDGIHYLEMELVDGFDVARLAKMVRLSHRAIIQIALGVARGLAYAHACCAKDGTPLRIVHRDISPQNVLVSRDGMVKLADFGIARFEGRAFQTGFGPVRGKLSYMAPEQITYAHGIDYRADLFALGAVVTELLLGRPLMPKGPVLAGDLRVPIERALETLVQPVPSEFKDLLIWLCAYEPEHRPWAASEVISQLELIENRLKDQAPLQYFARRHIANEIPSSEAVIRNLIQGLKDHISSDAMEITPLEDHISDHELRTGQEFHAYPSTGLMAQLASTGELDVRSLLSENPVPERENSQIPEHLAATVENISIKAMDDLESKESYQAPDTAESTNQPIAPAKSGLVHEFWRSSAMVIVLLLLLMVAIFVLLLYEA